MLLPVCFSGKSAWQRLPATFIALDSSNSESGRKKIHLQKKESSCSTDVEAQMDKSDLVRSLGPVSYVQRDFTYVQKKGNKLHLFSRRDVCRWPRRPRWPPATLFLPPSTSCGWGGEPHARPPSPPQPPSFLQSLKLKVKQPLENKPNKQTSNAK